MFAGHVVRVVQLRLFIGGAIVLTVLGSTRVASAAGASVPATAMVAGRPSVAVGPDESTRKLTEEMGRLWTRNPDRLVEVIRNGAAGYDTMPLSFLLAIANAETNGRILIVSEAGAVGLAQATPIAVLSEGMHGNLYITPDYVEGAFAYYLKKPLHDVDLIATRLLEENGTDAEKRETQNLLNAAFKYRREGIDDLEMLTPPFTSADFHDRVEARDGENLRLLETLEKAVAGGLDRAQITALRDASREQYRIMMRTQKERWRIYQDDLAAQRDAMLRDMFHADPAKVMDTDAYAAGEMLAAKLDLRFSPTLMARFLAQHVGTKLAEARELGVPASDVERMTAGLYNGGAHNIKRMIAGLIGGLPETDNYMRKVPSTREKLDEALASR